MLIQLIRQLREKVRERDKERNDTTPRALCVGTHEDPRTEARWKRGLQWVMSGLGGE